MKLNVEKLLPWVVIGGGLLIVWKLLGKAKEYREDAEVALADKLEAWFGPTNDVAQVAQVAAFPDGQFHAVPIKRVDPNGFFVNSNLAANYSGDGARYRLGRMSTPITRNGISTYWTAVRQ